MAKVKKPFKDFTEAEIDAYRNGFVKTTLRRASYRWPWRNLAIQASKKGRNQYECAQCKALVPNKEKHLDHIEPIVPTGSVFSSRNIDAKRFYPGLSGWQVLCKSVCHRAKTEAERAIRTEARRKARQRKTKDGAS